jgi:hypothetical protein
MALPHVMYWVCHWQEQQSYNTLSTFSEVETHEPFQLGACQWAPKHSRVKHNTMSCHVMSHTCLVDTCVYKSGYHQACSHMLETLHSTSKQLSNKAVQEASTTHSTCIRIGMSLKAARRAAESNRVHIVPDGTKVTGNKAETWRRNFRRNCSKEEATGQYSAVHWAFFLGLCLHGSSPVKETS